MKLIKSLLLGTAAGFAATAGAQAADLPSKKAAPVDYVRVCTIGSFTGFVIPGSDTCLRVGGFVRYQANFAEARWNGFQGGFLNGRTRNTFTQAATASIKLDARTTTEYGLLRSFADVRVNDAGAGIDKAYIQFAGFHAGKVQSLFDFYADDASYGGIGLGSDHSAVAIGYTASFGGGFYGVLSLEAPQRVGLVDGLGNSYYGGQRAPDLVAALGIEQGWGKAQLSAALHHLWSPQNSFVLPGGAVVNTANSEFGWAVQGGLKINLPSVGTGDALFLQAAYADGAVTYLGLPGTSFGNIAGGFASAYDFSYNSAGSLKKVSGWNVLAAYEHGWSPTLFSNIGGGYTVYDPGSSANFSPLGAAITTRKAEVWQAFANVTWKPVKGFLVAAEVDYFSGQLNRAVPVAGGAFTKKSDNIWAGLIRVQRDF